MKVAILGTAPDWVDAPFNDESWQIWVCNRAGLKMQPFHRLFEIHKNWDYENADAKDKYLAALKEIEPPQQVVSIVPLDSPANVVIDRDYLFKKYGSIWFSSSFGYMIAQALEEGAEEIGFWGVDMAGREEYVVQFAGVRHFIDIARERGVKVHIPDRSLLRRDPIPYADRFETPLALALEGMAARGDKAVKNVAWGLEKAKRHFYETRGRYFESSAGSDRDSELREKLNDAEQRMEEYKDAYGRIKGELWAVQHIRRLFVFNVLDPDIGEESAIDAENSGPT